jgi:hypothetical protein
LIKYLFLFFVCVTASAAPKEIEVWFLSNSKTALIESLLNKSPYVYRAPAAQLQCQEMGDHCFDPQYGLYKKGDATEEIVETLKIEQDVPSIPPARSLDRDLINCDKGNYFDVFCGKAKSEAKTQTKLDIWVDTSSSMREFDFTEKDGSCHRKSFMKQIDDQCGFNQKVNVMMFDTSIKQAGAMDQLCLNQGLNDFKRLIDWIERSEAKKLIVITDIYELHKEFADFIETKHGKLRGDKEPLTAKQLVDLADQLAKSCK